MSGDPSVCAKGASVSVSTRSFGIASASARPFADANMSGPTLNQHPSEMARSNSLRVPENQ
jgi:hypothetical protein